jgi:tetratricopeptide (TPR) repeat protein
MQASGDRLAIARALNNLAATYDLLGDHEKAMAYYMDCLALRRELNDRAGTAYTLRNMAGLLTDQKRYAEAYMMFQEALQRLRAVGEKLSIANVLQGMGELAQKRQRYDDARACFLESLALCREVNIAGGVRFALRSLTELGVDENDLVAARDYQRQLIEVTRGADVPHWRADVLMIAARIAAAENRSARAVELLGAVRSLRVANGQSTVVSDELLDRCAQRLDPAEYADALARGEQTGLDALFDAVVAEIAAGTEETRND